MRQMSELGLGSSEDEEWMEKKDLFSSLSSEMQSPPPLSREGREEREFTEKSQEEKSF